MALLFFKEPLRPELGLELDALDASARAAIFAGNTVPDGAEMMSTFLGKHAGSGNTACFADAQFDATWRKALLTAPGPARAELFRAMQERLDTLAVARPLPTSEIRILKQPYVLGPFGTSTDWLQLMTLGVTAR